jgi:nucleoside phosphorylase
MRIGVVSFNDNEARAVDQLLSDLASGAPSPWRRAGKQAVERDFGLGSWHLEHLEAKAQGNVVAGAELAALFAARKKRPEFVVFYGCAGAVDPVGVGEVFLVERAHYLSLGTVEAGADGERVTLKNKWLCNLEPQGDVNPLPPGTFPLCAKNASVDIPTVTGIPTARVVATDKVLRVAPGVAPVPIAPGPPSPFYLKEEWTYGDALAFVDPAAGPLLVEMESFGVARVAEALDILDKVIVMRITTDSLVDHSASDARQAALLMNGRKALARLLKKLYEPGVLGN